MGPRAIGLVSRGKHGPLALFFADEPVALSTLRLPSPFHLYCGPVNTNPFDLLFRGRWRGGGEISYYDFSTCSSDFSIIWAQKNEGEGEGEVEGEGGVLAKGGWGGRRRPMPPPSRVKAPRPHARRSTERTHPLLTSITMARIALSLSPLPLPLPLLLFLSFSFSFSLSLSPHHSSTLGRPPR